MEVRVHFCLAMQPSYAYVEHTTEQEALVRKQDLERGLAAIRRKQEDDVERQKGTLGGQCQRA